ncbi:hypothetical protein V2J09_002863 [Rumex salicifolius]
MSSVQGVFFVTAMAAVSGTAVVLLALKIHKSIPQPPPSPAAAFPLPRPCISSGEKKLRKALKKKVSFAKDVVEPTGNNEEFRRRLQGKIRRKSVSAAVTATASGSVRGVVMPANRAALYNGILRNRLMYRVGCSY